MGGQREHAVIGFVHPDLVRVEFMGSTLATVMLGRTKIDAVTSVKSGPNISRARNTLVRRFMEEQRAPWLLMIDTDMVFAHDALDRLIAAADPKDRPIMGGLCFVQGDGDFDPPTLLELIEDPKDGRPRFAPYKSWPDDAVMQVSGTGTAFLLVHRSVFDRIVRYKPDPVTPWFRETAMHGRLMGEDLTFCLRAGAAGIPVHVHTGVQIGHMKSYMIGKVI